MAVRIVFVAVLVTFVWATVFVNVVWVKTGSQFVRDELEGVQARLQGLEADLHGLEKSASSAVLKLDNRLEVVAQKVTAMQSDISKASASSVDMPTRPMPRQWTAGADVQQDMDMQLAHIGMVDGGCSSQRPASGIKFTVTTQLIAPVVVIAYNRPKYLAKAMVSLLKHWMDDSSNSLKFPIFVSIDGAHAPTIQFALALRNTTGVQVIQNQRSPSICKPEDGHCHLALHYLMVVQLFFNCLKAPRLILLEEDLQIAPDFFSYFEATAPLLDNDSSLLCVSAWNDHGQQGRVLNTTALYRTDVMPGLGWMLHAKVAYELLPGWQTSMTFGGWDEYMRNPCTRKGRQCIFPEVSRTYTFGEVGNSQGMFFHQHLANMVLNDKKVDFKQMDLSYLHETSYAALMQTWLQSAIPMAAADKAQLAAYCSPNQAADPDTRDLALYYGSHQQFLQYAQHLAPMLDDISLGGRVPRQSYNGTVIVRCRGRRLFLVAATPPSPPSC